MAGWRASAPLPKFVIPRGQYDTNFGSKGALANITIPVPLFDLKFLHELAATS
jgi:hypothetical protein